jgi:hypothetical protein
MISHDEFELGVGSRRRQRVFVFVLGGEGHFDGGVSSGLHKNNKKKLNQKFNNSGSSNNNEKQNKQTHKLPLKFLRLLDRLS